MDAPSSSPPATSMIEMVNDIDDIDLSDSDASSASISKSETSSTSDATTASTMDATHFACTDDELDPTNSEYTDDHLDATNATCTDDEQSPTPCPLDYQAYPHIFTRIIELAPIAALFPLRATCRDLRVQVDTKRLAQHVIVDNTRAYTRYGGIWLNVPRAGDDARYSVGPRPELIRHTRTLDFDLDCGECKCVFRCHCAAPLDIIKAIAIKARVQTLDLDLIRVFLPNRVKRPLYVTHPVFRAKRTVHFTELASDKGGPTILPVTPIAGSHEVIINISTYGQFNPTTEVYSAGEANKTVIMFTAQWTSDGVPKFAGPKGLAASLAGALAEKVANGISDAHLTIVGLEQWPQQWFPQPSSQLTSGTSPEDFGVSVVRNAFVDSYVRELNRKLSPDHRLSFTEDEMRAQAAAKLSLVRMRDYEDIWSSRHPDGISIIRRR